MDLSKCHCDCPGFCKTFNRTMGTDPPDWLWCQRSSEKQRKSFYDIVSKERPEPEESRRFVRLFDLYQASQRLIPYLSQFDAFVGVPRSGMIPASYLSVLLSKPLFSIIEEDKWWKSPKPKLEMLKFMSDFGGTRMNNYIGEIEKLVFIDDTTHNGATADRLRKVFGHDIKIVSVFSRSFGAEHINAYGEILESPHLLEWNFFNSGYVTTTMFDIDGIFCDNVPIDVCEDEEKYVRWIENVDPYHHRIPKLFKAKALVTGRLEKYRTITERWLAKHGFNYEQLIMFPTEREQERNADHYNVVGEYKAEALGSTGNKLFVESEPSEARVIKANTVDRVVICPNEGIVL